MGKGMVKDENGRRSHGFYLTVNGQRVGWVSGRKRGPQRNKGGKRGGGGEEDWEINRQRNRATRGHIHQKGGGGGSEDFERWKTAVIMDRSVALCDPEAYHKRRTGG